MAQFSVEITRLSGSVLGGNQQDIVFYAQKSHDEGWQAAFTRGSGLDLTRFATGAQAEELLRDPSTATHIVFNHGDEDWIK